MSYDNNLQQLQQKVALKKQLEAKLNDLREQRKVFDKQVIELRVAHRSEQEDVEKLEGKSLANYFYQVIGKLLKPAREKALALMHISPDSKGLHLYRKAVTFILVCFAWIFFRARKLSVAFTAISRIFNNFNLNVN